MPSYGVFTEVVGDKHLIHTMETWAAKAANAVPAYEAMHQYLLDVEKALFDTEGQSGEHGPWEGRKEQDGPSAGEPILQATGALMDSLTNASDPNHHWAVTPFGFAFGSSLNYAQAHMTGTEFMPPRRPVDLTAENRAMLVQILHLWITRSGMEVATPGMFFQRVRGARGRFIA